MSPNQDPLQPPPRRPELGILAPRTVMAATAPGTKPLFSTYCSFTLPITLQSRYFYCPHFIDEETGGPRDERTCLRSHSLKLRTGIQTQAARPPSQGSGPRRLGAPPSSARAGIGLRTPSPGPAGPSSPSPRRDGCLPGSYIQGLQSLAQLQRPESQGWRGKAGGRLSVPTLLAPVPTLLICPVILNKPRGLWASVSPSTQWEESYWLPLSLGEAQATSALGPAAPCAGPPWASLLNSET